MIHFSNTQFHWLDLRYPIKFPVQFLLILILQLDLSTFKLNISFLSQRGKSMKIFSKILSLKRIYRLYCKWVILIKDFGTFWYMNFYVLIKCSHHSVYANTNSNSTYDTVIEYLHPPIKVIQKLIIVAQVIQRIDAFKQADTSVVGMLSVH